MFRRRSLVAEVLLIVLTVCALISAKNNVNHRAKRKRNVILYTLTNTTENEWTPNRDKKNYSKNINIFDKINIKTLGPKNVTTMQRDRRLHKGTQKGGSKLKINSTKYSVVKNITYKNFTYKNQFNNDELSKTKKLKNELKNSRIKVVYKQNQVVNIANTTETKNESYLNNRGKRKAEPQYYFSREPMLSNEQMDLHSMLHNQDIPIQNSEMLSENLAQRNRFSSPQMQVLERKSLRDRLLEALNRRIQGGTTMQYHPNLLQETSALIEKNEAAMNQGAPERPVESHSQIESPYDHFDNRLFQKKEITPRPLPFINPTSFTNSRPLQDDMEFGLIHDRFYQGDRVHTPVNKFFPDFGVNNFSPMLNRQLMGEPSRLENPNLREQLPIPREAMPLTRSPVFMPHEDRDFMNVDPGVSLLSNNIGNLGDEVMPYGSLGESKPQTFIGMPRMHSDEGESQIYGQNANQVNF